MPILKTIRQDKIHKRTGTSNLIPKFLLLRLVRDCLEEQPAYYTRLSNTATRIHRPLYAIVKHNNPHTGVKFFKKKKNYKGLQSTTTNLNQDKTPHTKSKKRLGKDLQD